MDSNASVYNGSTPAVSINFSDSFRDKSESDQTEVAQNMWI